MRGEPAAAAASILAPLLTIIAAYFNQQLSELTLGRSSWQAEYDYVIVGSGAAGAVLAARLSEDPEVSVLLLEAGAESNLVNEIPLLANNLQGSSLDWAYKTVPQKNACLSMNERRSAWPRGKALGGSTAINYMLYVRGNKRDYDRWASEEGCEGWAWRDVFPYFLKAEDQRNPELLAETGEKRRYHSTGGPLTVSQLASPAPITRAFVKSAKYIGYDEGDYNGATQAVFSTSQATIRDGKRWSVAKAYLAPASGRPNLHIVTQALVTKILFGEETTTTTTEGDDPLGRSLPEARGVRFRRQFKDFEVLARREVIISAGVVNTPQLLMLSGIGPAEHLREHNIQVVSDLPGVGDNLQDHLTTWLLFSTKKDKTYERRVNLISKQNLADLLLRAKGPLTSTGGVEAFAFVKTNFTDATDDWPDIQIGLGPVTGATGGDKIKSIENLNEDFYEKFAAPYAGEDGFQLSPILLRPKSRGSIRLRSGNFTDAPLIDPRYLSHPDDIDALVQGLKICLAISETTPMQRFQAKPFETIVPGCEKYELYSDDYLRCYLQHFTVTIWHPVGTCRMGAPEDPRTVVDPRLRVKGVKRLRVVDASIMPLVVSGNLQAPTIMIGERAADMIKGLL